MRPHLLTALIGLALGGAVTPWTAAHGQCRPAKNSNEARLLAFYTAPIAFSTDVAATTLPRGALRLSAEVVPVPSPSSSIQQTGACFTHKTEDTHLAPIFGRPRLALGLGGGVVVEASYLPPITFADATPNLGSLAISRMTPAGRVSILTRLQTTFGTVKGPITCPASALQTSDSNAPCYGSRESHDTFHPTMFGGELALVSNMGQRWTWMAGAGLSALRPRFRVGFTDDNGYVDHTRIEVDLTRASVFGGLGYHILSRCDLGGQIYSVPTDVTTFRMVAGCRL